MHEHVQPTLAHLETQVDRIVRDHRFSLERKHPEGNGRRPARRGRVVKPGVEPLGILFPTVFRASDLHTALLEHDLRGLASHARPLRQPRRPLLSSQLEPDWDPPPR